MNILKQGMKGPSRPAPAAPGVTVNRYSPVTNWNDDPFSTDVFEPAPQYGEKRKPPPRPPPPKVNKLPDVPSKPSNFMRRPTVLSSLLSRKSKNTTSSQSVIITTTQSDYKHDADPVKIFPKCDSRNIQTGTLIDFASPPSSPTFTTRSSSDGLSVDSFGSDVTTSTNHYNAFNGGSISQAESGFEDDFDLFLNSRKICKEDTLDDFNSVDPFSPPPSNIKPPIMKKPVLNRDLYEISSVKSQVQGKGPTIIRAKPARPRPPDGTSVLRSTFGNSLPLATMSLNTTVPIQKVNGFENAFDGTKLEWEMNSPDRESSPPMPSVPPPPPPAEVDVDLTAAWPQDPLPSESMVTSILDDREPHAIALYDYFTGHYEDLSFTTNERIKLIRRVNDEWLYGSVKSGAEGLFPSNYVDVKVPLPEVGQGPPPPPPPSESPRSATALYDFVPDQPGDLPFTVGDHIIIIKKLNDEWYFGECKGCKGQFPGNYVQIN